MTSISISQEVTLSVVSHGQGRLVLKLLDSIEKYCSHLVKVIITKNIPEDLLIKGSQYSFPIKVIENSKPKGFAGNHNQAFKYCDTKYYCVINPDIQLVEEPFESLVLVMESHNLAMCAPKIVASNGCVEDSCRRYPTFGRMLKRFFFRHTKTDYDLSQGDGFISPDWIAGMFMLFSRESFASINGFDDKYFLYLEDADLCIRLRKAGKRFGVYTEVKVIHDAQRASRRKIKYLKMHMLSFLKYYSKHLLFVYVH